MYRSMIVLASLLIAPVIGSAQPPVVVPAGQELPVGPSCCPPEVVLAKAVNKEGKVELQLHMPKHVYVEKEQVVVKDGKEVVVRTTETKAVVALRTYIADGKQVIVTHKTAGP